jgi:hypothetical protein
MSNETTNNFWAAFSQWTVPEPAPAPIRRLYYDPSGTPLFYSSEDLPGNYIDVDMVTFFSQPLQNTKVVNGQLVRTAPTVVCAKLVPDINGTPCSPHNVAVVVSAAQAHQYWKLKKYAKN